jgi:hypothetical protein
MHTQCCSGTYKICELLVCVWDLFCITWEDKNIR